MSVDIASVAVFGGHATGRLDVNPGQPASLSLRTSGSQLDAKELASAFQLPLGFSGPVMLQAALTMPVTMRQPAEDVSAAAGTFSIRFPAGGSLEGDVAQTLGTALLEQDLGWGLRGSSFPFTVASIDGIVKPGGIDLKVEGQSGDKGIGGSFRIAFPGAAVSGTLLASETLGTGASEAGNAPAETASYDEAGPFWNRGRSHPFLCRQTQPVELGQLARRASNRTRAIRSFFVCIVRMAASACQPVPDVCDLLSFFF